MLTNVASNEQKGEAPMFSRTNVDQMIKRLMIICGKDLLWQFSIVI